MELFNIRGLSELDRFCVATFIFAQLNQRFIEICDAAHKPKQA